MMNTFSCYTEARSRCNREEELEAYEHKMSFIELMLYTSTLQLILLMQSRCPDYCIHIA